MVSVNSFYGKTSIAQLRIERILNDKPLLDKKALPPFLNCLLGPSRTWKVFQKQEEAIQSARKLQNGLMAFAFQHSAGERSFLVCHPVVLWYVYLNRPLRERCSYEVIQENSLSKLYLDLEFDYNCNPSYDFTKGEVMVNTLICVFTNFLNEEMNVNVSADHFLDLDSSNDKKFSRHVILNIPNKAFASNYTVGNIVKSVCFKIQNFVFTQNIDQSMFGVSMEQLRDLFIVDRKGVKKMFVDLTVYSRNRHFRLLGSTKLFMNSPLKISSLNTFMPKDNQPHSMFISSLITNFGNEELSIIQFGSSPSTSSTLLPQSKGKPHKIPFGSESLDKFILQQVEPFGRIRQKIQMQPGKIKYDIFGYRYCHNIKREHKSNNIFYIVDLERYLLYQLCYDPECKQFISNGIVIPPNVLFSSADDSILFEVSNYMLSNEELMQFIDCDKDIFSEKSSDVEDLGPNEKSSEFLDMDLTDSELCDIVTFSEYVL